MIKYMDWTQSDHVGLHADRRRLDWERRIGHSRKPGVGAAVWFEYRQIRQRRAIMIELSLLLHRGIRDPVGAGKEAIKMVEAPVLRINHDDRLDLAEPILRSGCTDPRQHASECNCNCTGLEFHLPLLTGRTHV